MHPGCGLFRKANPHIGRNGNPELDERERIIDGALCCYCDKCHANLFYSLKEKEITPQVIHERRARSDSLQCLYSRAPVPDYTFMPDAYDKRVYLQYDCPLLGFRELLFPVIFEGSVIAVFFVGQLTLKTKQAFVTEAVKSVGERHPGCFDYSGRQGDEVVEEILRKHEKWLVDSPQERIITDDNYQEIIEKSIEEIRSFEGRLDDAFSHMRHAYIRESILPHLKGFDKYPPSDMGEEGMDDAVLVELWNRVERAMVDLTEAFSLRYALVFGTSRIVDIHENSLPIEAKAAGWTEVLSADELEALAVDPTQFPKEYLVCSPSIEENKNYLGILSGCDVDKLGDFQLVLIPVHPNPHSSIAILLGFGGDNRSTVQENAPGEYLHQTLRTFFTLVVSTLSATLARGMEDLAKKQLLYLGHEAGQLAGGLDWLRKYYEDARGLERKLRKESPKDYLVIAGLRKKIEDLCSDIRGLTGQLSFVFETAKRLGTDLLPDVVPEYFLPYGDVICKWQDTYREECEKKKLQIRLEFPDVVNGFRSNDPWRPRMFADKFLFEQVVYNLVNNAEKYCYRGTKIHLDCKLATCEENAPHILTVTNYGRYMAPGGDVFLPFKRPKTSQDVQGLGLGLYIVSLIVVKIHGGKVQPECDDEPISQFNVALIRRL